MRTPRTCSEPGCGKKHVGRGLCHYHYHRARRLGLMETKVRRPRKSPAHLKSGTVEYARWWKANNPRPNKPRRRSRKIL